jgi:hypothetical protein
VSLELRYFEKVLKDPLAKVSIFEIEKSALSSTLSFHDVGLA